MATLVALRRTAEAAGLELDVSALPDGAERLLELAFAVPEREGARRKHHQPPFLELVGDIDRVRYIDRRRLPARRYPTHPGGRVHHVIPGL